MNKKLTAAEMAKAKRLLARDRGIGAESVTDESVELALANNSILLSSLGETPSSPSACDSSSFDAGSSSGGGCD